MSIPSYSASSTVDANEIPMFDKFSTVWWDKTGIMKILHSTSTLTVQLIEDGLMARGFDDEELIPTPTSLRDKLILDVGCGGGLLSEPLAKTGCTVVGIDINASLIEVAKKHASKDASLTNLTYHLESIEEHSAAKPEKYDVVVASYVLEHVNNQDLFLHYCAKCVKPGGSIFVTCMGKTTRAWLIAILLFENVLGLIPRGAHDWDKFINAEDTTAILEKSKCKSKLVKGLFYNMFTDKWSLIGSTSVFYIIWAIKDT